MKSAKPNSIRTRLASGAAGLLLITTPYGGAQLVEKLPAKFPLPASPLEQARSARPRAYFEAVGRKAALLGNESGIFESWVFPMKLFHDARLTIAVEGQDSPIDFSAAIDRIVSRPESTTLVASNPLFTLRTTFFSPIDLPGSVLLLDFDTARPLTLTLSFVPDLTPMWPAGLGGQSAGWRDDLKAFVISESRRKFNGILGSPAANRGVATPAHQLASGALRFDIAVSPALARKFYYPVIIVGNMQGRAQAVELYQAVLAGIPELYRRTADHYRRLRENHTTIETPLKSLDRAFEWAKIGLDKGFVDHPDLGLGLVAGWGTTDNGTRPGFGWFFGGDAAINSYAITGYGDFAGTAAALRFLAKYQRADGKIPHEISQSAGMIRWFDEYPYAYYHADTTPLYLAAARNLIRQSGDRAILAELWPTLVKAYAFCTANDGDGDGILENSKAGLGASELGSLLTDLHQDILLAASHTEASLAMQELAALQGDTAQRDAARGYGERAREAVNHRYWNAEAQRFAYALTKSGQQNMEMTAWTALPLFFGQWDPTRVHRTLEALASSQLSTDWGTRMLADSSPAYDPIAYNNGGVWPFLTGFVATGEYTYQRSFSGFAHLLQVARMTFDFAQGYAPEILSGDYYRPLDESVPHQLFSSGMVITPLLRGMLGLQPEAAAYRLRLAPQLPAGWDHFRLSRWRAGSVHFQLDYRRSGFNRYRWILEKTEGPAWQVDWELRLPFASRLRTVRINGQPTDFESRPENVSRLMTLTTEIRDRVVLELETEGGLELDVPVLHPQPGDASQDLKVLELRAESGEVLVVRLEGRAGRSYRLRAGTGTDQLTVRGAQKLGNPEGAWRVLEVVFPPQEAGSLYTIQEVRLACR